MHRTKVKIVEEALDANNTIAQANRADFDRAGVRVVNFMSAPGAGKTSLLEHVVADTPGVRIGVLEGDVQGSMDADRLAATLKSVFAEHKLSKRIRLGIGNQRVVVRTVRLASI